MKRTRLLNDPKDYAKIGVNENAILPWEDGRRDDGRVGAYEWWYFDSIMDDGTKVVIIFYDKYASNIDRGITPHAEIIITQPDGTSYSEHFEYAADEAVYSKDGCNVKIGPHSFVGDLKEYTIKIDPVNGLGAEIKLTNLGQSWRPASGYIGFGDQDEEYFTWLCAVPKGKITGNVTVNGKHREIQGFGYHDHQWGNIHAIMAWNHWIWIRQNVGDYNILVFDLVTSKEFGYKRYPLVFIQDKEGNIVFENTENVKFEVLEEYLQEETNKLHPKSFKYIFENSGKKVEYTLSMENEIDCINNYKLLSDEMRAMFDQLDMYPSYTRYAAQGELVITDRNQSITRTGSLIYEMIYNSKSYKEHV